MGQDKEALATQYQRDHDPETIYALWQRVERLVRKMSRRYLYYGRRNGAVDLEDLRQCGFLAVERAAREYEPGKGAFGTLLDLHFKREAHSLLGLRGRVRREHYAAVSMAAPVGGEDGLTLEDTLLDHDAPDMDAGPMRDAVRAGVEAALGRLSEERRRVVRGYYLDGRGTARLAGAMGLDAAKVTRIRTDALRALGRDWRLRTLADELECCAYRRKGVRGFGSDRASVVEDAVMRMEGLLRLRTAGGEEERPLTGK